MQNILRGNWKLKYFIYGDDEFLVKEKINSIKRKIEPNELLDSNLSDLEGKEISLDLLIANATAVPFLSNRRIVIARYWLGEFQRRPGSSKVKNLELQKLIKFLENIPESTDLIFVENQFLTRSNLSKLVNEKFEVLKCNGPNYASLFQWIQARANSYHILIEPAAIRLLGDSIGLNTRLLVNELHKLNIYCRDQKITKFDVELLVASSKESSIFQIIDSILERNLNLAISKSHMILDQGADIGLILFMLARQIRLITLAKYLKKKNISNSQYSNRLGVHGYALEKTIKQELLFSESQLDKIQSKILEIEILVKSSNLNQRLLTDRLIYEIFELI